MIKRIIFDVDNTLLDTYKDCINAYAEFLKDYPNIKPKMFYDVIGEFELKGIGFDKDELSKYISNRLKIDFSKEDFIIRVDGSYDLELTPQYLDNQTFRIVIVPASLINSIDKDNYEAVISTLKINQSQIQNINF